MRPVKLNPRSIVETSIGAFIALPVLITAGALLIALAAWACRLAVTQLSGG